MPAQQKQSSLAARLGEKVRKAFEEKKADAPEFDSQAGLPAGIEGGVAQLVECKFLQVAAGKQNAGKDMFFAAGVVVSPTETNGVNLVGLRTMISEPLYDTPTRSRKSVEEHVEWVMNEMKKLGIDMSEMSIDDIEDVAATLKEQQPHFRFRTWAGSKQEIESRGGKFFVGTKGPYSTEAGAKAANPFAGTEPRVQHTWNGACEYVGEDDGGGVADETEEAPAKQPVKSTKATKTRVAPEKEEPEVDLVELATAADGGDQDSAGQLSNLAKEAGVDEDAINSADSWASVVELMQGEGDGEGGEGEETEEAADDWKPEKGEVYPYKAPGKKKAVDCEVTAVFETRETVNLKDLNDEKVYKAIPWAKLEK
jgi:hypothetical protein